MKEEFEARGLKEKKKFKQLALQAAQDLKKDTKELIAEEFRQAEESVRNEIVTSAFNMAKEKISRELTKEQNQNMQDLFCRDLKNYSA